MGELRIDRLDCTRLDDRTVLMQVRERWGERRLFGRVELERVKSYVLPLGVGRWLDGDRFLLVNDPRHLRLCELLMAHEIERRVARVVGF